MHSGRALRCSQCGNATHDYNDNERWKSAANRLCNKCGGTSPQQKDPVALPAQSSPRRLEPIRGGSGTQVQRVPPEPRQVFQAAGLARSEGLSYYTPANARLILEDADRSVVWDEEKLRTVKLIVLDNSIRETTVGAVRGHTLETKKKILKSVLQTGVTHAIVGSFDLHVDNVDDQLGLLAKDFGSSKTGMPQECWGFSTAYDLGPAPSGNGKIPIAGVPSGAREIKSYNMKNVILELDFAHMKPETEAVFVDVVTKNVLLCRQSLGGKVAVNLRDFSFYRNDPSYTQWSRALKLVYALGKLNPPPFGILIEEPTGMMTPHGFAAAALAVRRTMDRAGWTQGHLMAHVHMNFGLGNGAVLESICNGVDGIWAALCEPGAHVGHACSANTLVNLARFGNTWVQNEYNLPKIVEGARQVHELATGMPANPMKEVYGSCAFDAAFANWHGFEGGAMNEVAKMVGATVTTRISDFADAKMLERGMEERFGPAKTAGWKPEFCPKMEKALSKQLLKGERYDNNAIEGLAQLYETAGGTLTKRMLERITLQGVAAKRDTYATDKHPLLVTLKARWLALDNSEVRQAQNKPSLVAPDVAMRAVMASAGHLPDLPIDTFLDAIQDSPQLAAIDRAKLQEVLDVDRAGKLRWEELAFRLRWGLIESSHNMDTPEELMAFTFRALTK